LKIFKLDTISQIFEQPMIEKFVLSLWFYLKHFSIDFMVMGLCSSYINVILILNQLQVLGSMGCVTNLSFFEQKKPDVFFILG